MNTKSPFKLHFESGKSEADKAYSVCVMQYGQSDLEKADVHVVLGGDGSMLAAMHNQIDKGINIPLFGLNYGHVGRMCNTPYLQDLFNRIQQAQKQEIIPLKLTATSAEHGWRIEAYAFNEFSVLRDSPQAAYLKLTIQGNGIVMNVPLEGDGMIVSTPIGSSGYYKNIGGEPILLNQKNIGLRSINTTKTSEFLLSDDTRIAVNKFQGEKRPIMVEGDGQRFSNISRAVISVASNQKRTILFDRINQNYR